MAQSEFAIGIAAKDIDTGKIAKLAASARAQMRRNLRMASG
jgi:hypothetical protein